MRLYGANPLPPPVLPLQDLQELEKNEAYFQMHLKSNKTRNKKKAARAMSSDPQSPGEGNSSDPGTPAEDSNGGGGGGNGGASTSSTSSQKVPPLGWCVPWLGDPVAGILNGDCSRLCVTASASLSERPSSKRYLVPCQRHKTAVLCVGTSCAGQIALFVLIGLYPRLFFLSAVSL